MAGRRLSDSARPSRRARPQEAPAPAALPHVAKRFGAPWRGNQSAVAVATEPSASRAAPARRPPYRAYAVIMGTFAGGLATVGALARALDRDAEEHSWLDLATLAAASFKASRTISRDEVTSFLREPFVEGDAHEGGEGPVETGDMRQAIGELVTCSRCIGTWVAAGLASTQVLAPRFGRLLTWTLGTAALNDFLQAGFAALTAKANELQERTD